jgi:hypothetical protein
MEKHTRSLFEAVSRTLGTGGAWDARLWQKSRLALLRVGSLFAVASVGFIAALNTPANAGVCIGKPAGFVCRPAVGPCDVADVCNGKANGCAPNAFVPDGTSCNDSNSCTIGGTCQAGVCTGGVTSSCNDNNPCTVDACDAQSGCVHTPGNAGTVCRAAAGACDVAEVCSGSSAACPADVRKPAGTVCRAAAGACDVAETCAGSAQCPEDKFVAAGTE